VAAIVVQITLYILC